VVGEHLESRAKEQEYELRLGYLFCDVVYLLAGRFSRKRRLFLGASSFYHNRSIWIGCTRDICINLSEPNTTKEIAMGTIIFSIVVLIFYYWNRLSPYATGEIDRHIAKEEMVIVPMVITLIICMYFGLFSLYTSILF
jgi:hypothetical protein